MAKTLPELRAERDWSQYTLATKIGVTPSTILRWEKGLAEPSASLLRELAAVFGVRMDDIDLPPRSRPRKGAA
jgi:putative transcriptional regulator